MGKSKGLIKVFLDTNILISGFFFKGNEAQLLTLPIDFITSDIVVEELKNVTLRKFFKVGTENKKIILQEIYLSLKDFQIINYKEYFHKLNFAKTLLSKDPDYKILAAVLTIKPNYFITGDKDFHTDKIKNIVKVINTKELLQNLKS